MNQISHVKPTAMCPRSLPAEFGSLDEEIEFVADAGALMQRVAAGDHEKLPAWVRRAAESQADLVEDEIAHVVSSTPATLALQASTLRRLLEASGKIPGGGRERDLIDSLCAGLDSLAGRQPVPVDENVLPKALAELLEIDRAYDAIDDQINAAQERADRAAERGLRPREESLRGSLRAALRGVCSAPAATLRQFNTKLELLLSDKFADLLKEELVASLRADAERLLS
jgi:hypothetical protein